MSFDLDRMVELNAIHAVWNEDFSYQHEAKDYEAQLNALLDETDEPQYVILDMTQSSMSFNDIMFGIQRVRKNETSLFDHPKAKQFIVVSTNKAIQLSASGLERIGVSDLNIKVVDSVDAAKEYILKRAV